MADEKISAMSDANTLDGTELLPLVQAGDNVKSSVDGLANYVASPGSGFSGWSVMPLNGNNVQFVVPGNAGVFGFTFYDNDGQGLFLNRDGSGYVQFGGRTGDTLDFNGFSATNFNGSLIFDSSGNFVDNSSNIMLDRMAGQQPAIADATGTGDVVAQLNTLLGALRNLKLLAT